LLTGRFHGAQVSASNWSSDRLLASNCSSLSVSLAPTCALRSVSNAAAGFVTALSKLTRASTLVRTASVAEPNVATGISPGLRKSVFPNLINAIFFGG